MSASVFFFSIWGSADRHSWASLSKRSADSEVNGKVTCCSHNYQLPPIGVFGSTGSTNNLEEAKEQSDSENAVENKLEVCPNTDTFAAALQWQPLEDTTDEENDSMTKFNGVRRGNQTL